MHPLHAWRGVVLADGTIVAWPALLLDHAEAFDRIATLRKYRCRWRQWSPGKAVDFDPGCSQEDQEAVLAWIDKANS